jgi:TonB family protein
VIAASSLRLVGVLMLSLQLMAQSAAAQHVLIAGDGGQMYLVCSANGTVPRVQKDGKIVSIIPHGYALREVDEFAPVFVKVSNVNVGTSSDNSGQLNNDFHFNADFESDSRLTDVFVVLALDSERAGKTLFLWGIGTLEPKKAKGVSIIVPMDSPIGSGHYSLHVFSGGAEVMQSMVPFMESEAALNRMVASRIKGVHNAAPKFFFGAAPDYPPELKKANLKGQAIISVRIGANGDVYDPFVKSATDPAFGDEALRAVRIWRFLPKVKDDYPVETKVEIPIVFSRPNPVVESP